MLSVAPLPGMTMLTLYPIRQRAKDSPQVGKWLIYQVFGGTGFQPVQGFSHSLERLCHQSAARLVGKA
jgi:hypothetical protein